MSTSELQRVSVAPHLFIQHAAFVFVGLKIFDRFDKTAAWKAFVQTVWTPCVSRMSQHWSRCFLGVGRCLSDTNSSAVVNRLLLLLFSGSSVWHPQQPGKGVHLRCSEETQIQRAQRTLLTSRSTADTAGELWSFPFTIFKKQSYVALLKELLLLSAFIFRLWHNF